MKKTAYIAMAMLLAAAPAAFAQDAGLQGRWSVTFSGGASIPAGGEFHEGGSGTVLGLPTAVDAKTNSDIYDPGLGWRAGVGYGVTRNIELFGDFAWGRAESSELSVGTVATLDLRASFGEYASYGLDAGMRYHFTPDARITPYVSALAGFRRIDAIPGTFSVPAAGVVLPDTPFFGDSTVPVFGGGAGVLVALSPQFSVGVEGGVRYHTDLSQIEGLTGTGLENLNDAGSGWSVPITGVVRFGF
ncbi:MAG TPA: outer membrane beta-barrel protein [Vicinamibacterales bacterium]|nr:outer membrane beta-barrel protein [Vicinamibacterales bacterium]